MPQPVNRTRRAFIGQMSAIALLELRRRPPDLILYNGHVLTVDRLRPKAEAVAITAGRFVAVGSNAEIKALAGLTTKRIDLGRRTVVPGFNDAHTHPALAGLQHLREVDCDLRSISAIQDALRERARNTPSGEWVLGFKYDDTKTAEGRPLTREDLDTAVPDHPVRVQHRGGHSNYVNSMAYQRAGITENTPDPAGGRFARDPDSHRLTGRVLERATEPFSKVIPSATTRADHREGVKLISRMLSRAGITSVTDAEGSPDDLRAYQDARESGDLSVRVYCMIYCDFLDAMTQAGVRTGLGDEWVRVGGIKMVTDGSISERTARLREPYIGRPNDYGILTMTEDELYQQAKKGHDAGWQLGTHANGDVAIDQTLRVYERLQRESPHKDPRFRLEHCTVIDADLVRRIKVLGAVPTPFAAYVYFHGEKMREYGAERLNRMFALRSFLDAGVMVAPGSDYPPGPFEPMMALQSSVTRKDIKGQEWGISQRITVEEAIRIGTLHGAYGSFEEREKGSIDVGKLADLVVLGRNPITEDPSTLVSIPIERTMAGGRWVYEA